MLLLLNWNAKLFAMDASFVKNLIYQFALTKFSLYQVVCILNGVDPHVII